MNKLYNISNAKEFLEQNPKYAVVPRDPASWKFYIMELRSVLGLSIKDFWEMFDISLSSGHKYESLKDGDLSRVLKKPKMELIVEVLGLQWEPTSKFGQYSEISNSYVLTNEGRQAIKLLNIADIDISDLEALLILHRHYHKQ